MSAPNRRQFLAIAVGAAGAGAGGLAALGLRSKTPGEKSSSTPSKSTKPDRIPAGLKKAHREAHAFGLTWFVARIF